MGGNTAIPNKAPIRLGTEYGCETWWLISTLLVNAAHYFKQPENNSWTVWDESNFSVQANRSRQFSWRNITC